MAEPGFKPMPSQFRTAIPFPASLRSGIFESFDTMSGLLEKAGYVTLPHRPRPPLLFNARARHPGRQ